MIYNDGYAGFAARSPSAAARIESAGRLAGGGGPQPARAGRVLHRRPNADASRTCRSRSIATRASRRISGSISTTCRSWMRAASPAACSPSSSKPPSWFLAEQALEAERAAVLEANKRLSAESAFLRDLFEQTPSFMAMMSGPDAYLRSDQQRLSATDRRARRRRPDRSAKRLPEMVEQGFVDLLDSVFTTGSPHIGSGTRVMLADAGEPSARRALPRFHLPAHPQLGRAKSPASSSKARTSPSACAASSTCASWSTS